MGKWVNFKNEHPSYLVSIWGQVADMFTRRACSVLPFIQPIYQENSVRFRRWNPTKKTAFLSYSVPFRTPKRESEGPIPQKHNDAAIAFIVYQAGKVLINYFSIKNKAKLQSLTTQQSYDFAESYSTKLKLESTIIPFDLFL